MYPFEQRKTIDIQFQSKNSMYPFDETHQISNVSTILQTTINTNLSHKWIETKMLHIKVGITNRNVRNIELINDRLYLQP